MGFFGSKEIIPTFIYFDRKVLTTFLPLSPSYSRPRVRQRTLFVLCPHVVHQHLVLSASQTESTGCLSLHLQHLSPNHHSLLPKLQQKLPNCLRNFSPTSMKSGLSTQLSVKFKSEGDMLLQKLLLFPLYLPVLVLYHPCPCTLRLSHI